MVPTRQQGTTSLPEMSGLRWLFSVEVKAQRGHFEQMWKLSLQKSSPQFYVVNLKEKGGKKAPFCS